MDHCFPEYDIWTQFVSADYTRALDLDALDSSHPIEVRCRASRSSHGCLVPCFHIEVLSVSRENDEEVVYSQI